MALRNTVFADIAPLSNERERGGGGASRSARAASGGFFVTGTDTGVGKTLIACALLHRLRSDGLRAVGMKPIAAGTQPSAEGPINGDVVALREASSCWAPLREVNPYCFDPPIAPHLAAREAGVRIEMAPIEQAFTLLRERADAVIVEGVGGFLVPLNDRQDAGDLAVALALPVVLVVGMRLGCLNHALLTQQAIESRSLRLAGWIANSIDLQMSHFDDNVQALSERIQAPLWGVVPFGPARPQDVAARLQIRDAALRPQTSINSW
jgi:dethiobiotin synthetase